MQLLKNEKVTDNIFLDTSELVKLYVDEDDSDKIRLDIINSQLVISQITIVEFHSAVFKKYRIKTINEQEVTLIINSFKTDIKSIKIVKIDFKIIISAVELIKKYKKEGLRTLDSIQIASALSENNIDEIISFDNLFNEIIKKEKNTDT